MARPCASVDASGAPWRAIGGRPAPRCPPRGARGASVLAPRAGPGRAPGPSLPPRTPAMPRRTPGRRQGHGIAPGGNAKVRFVPTATSLDPDESRRRRGVEPPEGPRVGSGGVPFGVRHAHDDGDARGHVEVQPLPRARREPPATASLRWKPSARETGGSRRSAPPPRPGSRGAARSPLASRRGQGRRRRRRGPGPCLRPRTRRCGCRAPTGSPAHPRARDPGASPFPPGRTRSAACSRPAA